MTDYPRFWLWFLLLWNVLLFSAYAMEQDCGSRGVIAIVGLAVIGVMAIFRPRDPEEEEEGCVAV